MEQARLGRSTRRIHLPGIQGCRVGISRIRFSFFHREARWPNVQGLRVPGQCSPLLSKTETELNSGKGTPVFGNWGFNYRAGPEAEGMHVSTRRY